MNNNAQALMQQQQFYRRNCNAGAVSITIEFKSMNKYALPLGTTIVSAHHNLSNMAKTMLTLIKIS